MKQFVEKFKGMIFQIPSKAAADQELKFIKGRKGILKALYDSKESTTIVGIVSPVLGDGMFLTAVDDINSEGQEITVSLKQYDMSGQILARTHLSLDEFKSVCSFQMIYKHPFFIHQQQGTLQD
jgi:hypothetical protein